ncbi:TonB-dependent receptor domain-containing protein [Celeribacter indicus]|uniref:TonB-dependent receptor plug n=1 Tax=Celeribacter indicus TaxID=1208324 RepID=A0A0B5E5T9_9RHOB|nr:TonB-dependent receptor [Celeribacter indicus]AJE48381.1 TonB-dependent receptor plug [Celeribacter indicus]SDW74431.1 hemoglobin/transferrin/lactoferrin receptor protein [Celeribacter indicus]
MTIRTHLLASAALLGAGALLPAATFAQDLSTGEPIELDAITVATSQRGVQTDTATSETVIAQEELEARQASSMAELVDTVPNVSLINGSQPQGAAVSIRGLGTYAGTYGSDGKVAVVVDGVASGAEEIYRNGGMLALEPELFRQVTVTRGPGEGFRFSSGAMGGTIEAQTKDASDFLTPGDSFAFRQKFGYESNGDGLLTSSILAFAPDDRFDVLAFVGYRTIDEREDGDGVSQDATGFDQPSALLKANYRITPDSTLTFSYAYNEIPEEDVPYDAFDPTWDETFVDRDTADTTAYLAYRYDPADNDLVNFEARLTYKHEEMKISSSAPDSASGIFNADHDTTTWGLRLENEALFASGAIAHAVTTGIEYKERERRAILLPNAVNGVGQNDPSAPGGTDKSIAVYLADRMEIGERLTLTPQLRYEHQKLISEKNGDAQQCFGNACIPSTPIPDGTSYEKDAVTGAFSARYALTDAFAVFGTVAYNENLPILDDLRSANITVSEKGVTHELGLSYDALDVFAGSDALRAKITGFQTRIWDVTTYSGVSDVDLDGFELELSYVHPDFYVDFNGARTRGTINDSNTPFDFVPADKVQLTLGKRFLDEQLDLSVGATHAWSQSRTEGSSATAPSDDWTTVALHAGYTPEAGPLAGVELRASVENIFDETYSPYLSSRNSSGRNLKLSIAKVF